VIGFNFGTFLFSYLHASVFQVNHMLQVAQKYQAAANESGPAGVSTNDAQAICNMLVNLAFITTVTFASYCVLALNMYFVLSKSQVPVIF
jgi:hypothetical protein